MKVYVHGGKFGDIVYSLPAFRWLGCECYGLQPRYGPPGCWVDERVILPLLESQGISVRVLRGGGVVAAGRSWVDGNSFRDWGRGCRCPGGSRRVGLTAGGFRAAGEVTVKSLPVPLRDVDWYGVVRRRRNIAEEHLGAVGLSAAFAAVPWLRVQPRRVAEFVVCRSLRYRPAVQSVPFGAAVRSHRGRCVFLGSSEEHTIFQRDFRVRLPFLACRNYLEAAEVMAGAHQVWGNQTGLMAVAAGLGVGRVLEVCERVPDAAFEYGWAEPRHRAW